jgi:hypothetical protein
MTNHWSIDRSLGDWKVVKALRTARDRIKGDGRILGHSDFVQSIIANSQEQLERRYLLMAKGYVLGEHANIPVAGTLTPIGG